uniref:Aromatic amino acid beta-eliminating lyase/threonine aldolase domain-containing protein n=1 Tax=Ditylenchus dipsaci TaxID=166011 RepID=A0A915E3C4_9BILA
MKRSEQINFASDNFAGAHSAITEALRLNAEGRATAYGKSEIDLKIEGIFNQVFKKEVAVFFVATGTAANALSMAFFNKPGGVIFAHEHCHMVEDECGNFILFFKNYLLKILFLGAVEHITGGARFCGIPGRYGKIDSEDLDTAIQRYKPEFVHSGRPMAVSITQSTESGTVYSLEHIDAIAAVCQKHSLPLHMDGARFANALTRLQCTPAEMTWKRGVDVCSFGATKNGCWCAEAIVVFNDVARAITEMPFLRKRDAHLFSKTRFIAAQFDAYFHDGLWLQNAQNANKMAELLARK